MIKSKYAALFLASLAVLCSASTNDSTYIEFHQMSKPTAVTFKANKGDLIQAFVEFNVKQKLMTVYLGDAQSIAYNYTNYTNYLYVRQFSSPESSSMNPFCQIVIQEYSQYLFFVQFHGSQSDLRVRISITINSSLILQHYQVLTKDIADQVTVPAFSNNDNFYKYPTFEFEALSPCFIHFSWQQWVDTENLYLYFYAPSGQLFKNVEGRQNFIFLNLTSAGKWRIKLGHIYHQDLIMERHLSMQTLDTHTCLRTCSQFSYPLVLGLAPGSNDVCVCNRELGNLVWNCHKRQCEVESNKTCGFCGNSLLEQDQECDTGGGQGCTNECVPSPGYTCTIGQKMNSSCVKDQQSIDGETSILVPIIIVSLICIAAVLLILLVMRKLKQRISRRETMEESSSIQQLSNTT